MKIAVIVATLFFLAGCTNREVYDSLHGARADECTKIPDATARQRCFDDAGKSYDEYERDRNR